MGKIEISTALRQKEVSGQLNKVIRALFAEGLIEGIIPDKLNRRLQPYRLTKPR
jgi:ATP-dependent DNA helicase RecG